jgi:hypothetical protein
MPGLTEVANTLKEAAGDLAKLSVTTYTGDINLVLKDDGKVDFDKLLTQAKTNADINVALATEINIDGDATHFIAKGEIPPYILTTHADAVKNGSEYRTQIISFLGGKVAGLFS